MSNEKSIGEVKAKTEVDRMLYQVCVVCRGSGYFQVSGKTMCCQFCKPIRAMPVGLTQGQLKRLHNDFNISKSRLDSICRNVN